MPVVLNANLGTNYEAGAAGSHTLTTTSAAAQATRVMVFAGWTTGPVASHLTSVSGGSLAWVVDRVDSDEANFFGAGIASAYAPAGLPSGTVITMNFDDATTAQTASAAASFFGVAVGASGYVDVTAAPVPQTSANWSTGTMVATQADLLVTTVYGDNERSSTTNAPATELFDFNGGTGLNSMTGAYQVVNAGSYALTGVWSLSVDWQSVAVGYKASERAVLPGDDPPPGILGRGAGW